MAVGGEGFDIKHLGGFVFLIFLSVCLCLHPDTPTGVGLEDKGPSPPSLPSSRVGDRGSQGRPSCVAVNVLYAQNCLLMRPNGVPPSRQARRRPFPPFCSLNGQLEMMGGRGWEIRGDASMTSPLEGGESKSRQRCLNGKIQLTVIKSPQIFVDVIQIPLLRRLREEKGEIKRDSCFSTASIAGGWRVGADPVTISRTEQDQR